MAAFFVFGAGMTGLALLGLLFPGGALEPMRQLYPKGRTKLASLGQVGVGLMAVASIACAGAASRIAAGSATLAQ